MIDQKEPPSLPQKNKLKLEKMPREKWEEMMKERLKPLIPIFNRLDNAHIPWAITGSFAAAIDEWDIEAGDIVADYAVTVHEEGKTKVIVAGITSQGAAVPTGFTEVLGHGMRILNKDI